ncbi:MAG: TfoX/Sxy family protein [Methanoregula sp.]|nr:TfoX/Sxy family protein [Methanoregula sp.]
MASDKSLIEFIVDQMGDAGCISYKKMFGEYAIYCDGKVVALVCDNQLFVKPTESGKSYIGNTIEAAPYPGARLYFLIEDAFEDPKWISDLIRITAKDLPIPPKKGIKNKRNKSGLRPAHG